MSGGVTSAIASKIALETYGKENCRFIFIDTRNEHEDTMRFLTEFCKKLEVELEIISSKKYKSIQEVWEKNLTLNMASGAVCSSRLKTYVRENWQVTNTWTYQVFGFDINEIKRVKSMSKNKYIKPIYPLLLHGLTKEDCFSILDDMGIKKPEMYNLGFENNNCFQTGCVQGGHAYWRKWYELDKEKYKRMADMEHKLTNAKGKPVTMLKTRTKEDLALVKEHNDKSYSRMFLLPHPDYPHIKSLIDADPSTFEKDNTNFECNGFCGLKDGEEWSEEDKKEFQENLASLK